LIAEEAEMGAKTAALGKEVPIIGEKRSSTGRNG
jgi:hypothetical protein